MLLSKATYYAHVLVLFTFISIPALGIHDWFIDELISVLVRV